MIVDSFLLSFKNLKHRGLSSWLTLLGIFIGVTAVVSLISLGNGLQVAVGSQFGISSTEILTVEAGGISFGGPPGTGVVNPLTISDLEEIRKLSSVERAIRRNLVSGRAEFNKKVIFGLATNIPDDSDDRKFVYDQIEAVTVAGRLLKKEDSRKVLLGYNFYVDNVGFDKEVRPGNNILINDVKYEVVGIVEKKGSFIFDNVVYMNEDDLEAMGDYGDNVDVIGVQAKDKDLMDKTKEDIEKLLRRLRDVKEGKEDFKVSTPEAQMGAVNDILGGVQAFIVIVASISIFIGALGIVNTMTTSVLERRRDIGIMKSVGATNANIFMQFFIESSLLGLMGGIVGALVGTLIGVLGTVGINSWLGSEIGMSVNFVLIGGALIGSFIIGGIAGIVPAMNAARENPVDALRS